MFYDSNSNIKHDLTNKRFGRLLAIKLTRITNSYSYWLCKCDCGNEIEVSRRNLTCNKTKSCGCYKKDCIKKHMQDVCSKTHIDGTNVSYIKSSNLPKNNTSGFKGVSKLKNGKYKAGLHFKGKYYNLGIYENIQDAIIARKLGEEKYYKPFLEKLLDK